MSTIIEEFMEEIGRQTKQVTYGSDNENYTVDMEEFDRQAAQVALSVYDKDGTNDTDGSMEEELALENIVEPVMDEETIEWDW